MLFSFLFFIGPLALPLLIYGLMNRATANESEDMSYQFPKAIWAFKIAMTVFLSIPLLICLLDYIFSPIDYEDPIGSIPLLFFAGPASLGTFLSAFASYPGYNYLFKIENNKKAMLVLAAPFIAIILISVSLLPFDNFLFDVFSCTGMPLILLVPYIPMSIILYRIRQKLEPS